MLILASVLDLVGGGLSLIFVLENGRVGCGLPLKKERRSVLDLVGGIGTEGFSSTKSYLSTP